MLRKWLGAAAAQVFVCLLFLTVLDVFWDFGFWQGFAASFGSLLVLNTIWLACRRQGAK